MTAAGSEALQVKKVLERAIRFVENIHTAEVVNSDLELMELPHEGSATDSDWDDCNDDRNDDRNDENPVDED